MKRICALLLVLCMAVSLCACGNGGKIEGKGFETPEEALLAYAEALKTGDVDKILATFAVETHVENFNMEEYIDFLAAYPMGGEYSLSPIDAFTKETGVIHRQYKITNQLSWMYRYIAFGEELDSNVITVNKNGEYKSASKFLKDLEIEDWMDILSEMEIGDVLEPEDLADEDLINEDLWDKTEDILLKRQEKYLGCDEVTGLALEIELDGEDYYLCPDLACYNGKWYMLTQLGQLASHMGAPTLSGGLVER